METIIIVVLSVLLGVVLYRNRHSTSDTHNDTPIIPEGYALVDEAAVAAEIETLKAAVYNAFEIGVKVGKHGLLHDITRTGNIRLGKVAYGRFVCTHTYNPLRNDKPVETLKGRIPQQTPNPIPRTVPELPEPDYSSAPEWVSQ